MSFRILEGDCREVLATLPDESVQCVVTSPPYYGLRDYGMLGQLGLEQTPAEYIGRMVEVFALVRRVLKKNGTLWINVGDSYAGSWGAQSRGNTTGEAKARLEGSSMLSARQITSHPEWMRGVGSVKRTPGCKPKDLIGIPWMLAFALRADGWYLRSDIVWAKPNGMPESVKDRPARAHEYVFLLSKSRRYFYDHIAVQTPFAASSVARLDQDLAAQHGSLRANGGAKTNGAMKAVRFGGNKGGGDHGSASSPRSGASWIPSSGANLRDVWWLPTQPFADAHFAVMPPALAATCILAGSARGGVVLDPFSGAGTTGLVCSRLGRDYIGIELNPTYAEMSRRRIIADGPLFHDPEAA